MSDEKKKWSTPVLRKITSEQAAVLLMTRHAEARAPSASAGSETVRLEQELAGMTQHLAKRHSRPEEASLRQSTPAANANSDYSLPYIEGEGARRTECKGNNN